MLYYLKLYLLIFKMSLMQVLVNRANFALWTFTHSFSLIAMILFFNSIYGSINSINGWSQYQSLLVLGIGTLIGGLGSMTFFPFMYSFEKDLANGDFDFRLAKPISVLFLSAFNLVDVEDMVIIPSGLILMGYALNKLQHGNLAINGLLFIFLITCSMLILFSVITLMLSLAFKAIKMSSAMSFYWTIVSLNKYPTKAIGKTSRLFMTALAPIALISSVPAEVLFGRYDWPWIIASPIVAITLFIFSKKVFYNALKDYSSASS